MAGRPDEKGARGATPVLPPFYQRHRAAGKTALVTLVTRMHKLPERANPLIKTPPVQLAQRDSCYLPPPRQSYCDSGYFPVLGFSSFNGAGNCSSFTPSR